jgi:hypothetical protein
MPVTYLWFFWDFLALQFYSCNMRLLFNSIYKTQSPYLFQLAYKVHVQIHKLPCLNPCERQRVR